MHSKSTVYIFLLLVFFQLHSYAQDSTKTKRLKRFGVGISIGSPDLLSIQGNAILPGMNNKLAIGMRTGMFQISRMNFQEWAVNISYYLKQSGNGCFITTEFERSIVTSSNDLDIAEDVTYNVDFHYYYRYYSFYAGYRSVMKRFFVTPEIGVSYLAQENYIMANTSIISASVPITENFKTNKVLPLIRLSFGIMF